jgi:hypothetical protein
MPVAKCLAGWTDFYAQVHLPNIYCLNVEMSVIDNLIDQMLPISVPHFTPDGKLLPLLLACIASLIMYDNDVAMD